MKFSDFTYKLLLFSAELAIIFMSAAFIASLTEPTLAAANGYANIALRIIAAAALSATSYELSRMLRRRAPDDDKPQ